MKERKGRKRGKEKGGGRAKRNKQGQRLYAKTEIRTRRKRKKGRTKETNKQSKRKRRGDRVLLKTREEEGKKKI